MSEFTPEVYQKGDVVKVANSASAAVALKFEGFKPQSEEPVESHDVFDGVEDEPVPAPPSVPTPKALAERPKTPIKDDK